MKVGGIRENSTGLAPTSMQLRNHLGLDSGKMENVSGGTTTNSRRIFNLES